MRDITCPLNPYILDRRLWSLIPSGKTALTTWLYNLDNFEQTLQSSLDINIYCESNLQQFLYTVLLSTGTILFNSVYFKTTWIQWYNIYYLQKTQEIKDILQKHKLRQLLHKH